MIVWDKHGRCTEESGNFREMGFSANASMLRWSEMDGCASCDMFYGTGCLIN